MELFKLLGTISVSNNDANEKIKDTTTKAEGLSGVFSRIGEGTVTISNKIATAAGVIGTAWVATTEGSREYRAEMGKLNTAFMTAGYSTETATNAYKTLFGVIGETDQSVEAAQQIALLAEAEKDVVEWSNLAAGVVGRFGDALQPETFFESANETLKLGEATGAYVQMLEGMGVSVDDFNAGLAACNTEAEKQAYMLNVTKSLLGDASKAYNENNKDIIDSNRAHGEMTDNIAKLGEMSEPVLTQLIDGINQMAEYALPKLESAFQWLSEHGEATAAIIATIATSIAIAAIAAHPYAAAIMAIVAGLVLLNEQAGKGQARYQNTFTEELSAPHRLAGKYAGWTDDQKTAAQYYISDYLGGYDTTDAVMELRSVGLSEEAITGFRADMSEALNSSDFTAEIADTWFEEGTEEELQNQIDDMSLESVVKMYADTSGLQAAVDATGLNAYVSVLPTDSLIPDSSNAIGLDRVPRDGYLIRAHKDETLLDKTDADIWRGGGVSRIEALLSQLVANTMGGQMVVLDTGAVVGQLAPVMDARLGTISSRKGRRN